MISLFMLNFLLRPISMYTKFVLFIYYSIHQSFEMFNLRLYLDISLYKVVSKIVISHVVDPFST